MLRLAPATLVGFDDLYRRPGWQLKRWPMLGAGGVEAAASHGKMGEMPYPVDGSLSVWRWVLRKLVAHPERTRFGVQSLRLDVGAVVRGQGWEDDAASTLNMHSSWSPEWQFS